MGHHERFDGGGYPRGVPAARLPIGAQIMCVADYLDAMTSDRPYRAGMGLEGAIAEFRRAAAASGTRASWRPSSGCSSGRPSGPNPQLVAWRSV